MRRHGILVGLFGSWLVTGMAAAQTPMGPTGPPGAPHRPPATGLSATTPETAGAFNKLSPGNQLIARALFKAQKAPPAGSRTTRPAPTAPPTPLTLDQIAAMKLAGKRWGQIFQQMKSQGLIRARDLGQVVSRSGRAEHGPVPSSKTTITTGGGQRQGAGRQGKPEGTGSGTTDGQESGVPPPVSGVSGRASSSGAVGGDGGPGSFNYGGGRGR